MLYLTKAFLISWTLLVSPFHLTCSKDAAKKAGALPSSDQYISWEINGERMTLASPSDSLSSSQYGASIRLAGTSPNRQSGVYIIFRGNLEAGTYPAIYSGFTIRQKDYAAAPNAVQVVVNSYDKGSDYVSGTFSGTVTFSTSTASLPISGSFRLKTH